MSNDPNKVIPQVISTITGLLTSALNEPTKSVKSFVYTSSSTAAFSQAEPNKKIIVTKDTWNDESVEQAWQDDPKPDGFIVYSASKTEGEKAVWKFVEEKKPALQVACVVPNANFGEIFRKEMPGSTAAWITTLFKGGPVAEDLIKSAPPRKSCFFKSLITKSFCTIYVLYHTRGGHKLTSQPYLEWFVNTKDTARLHVAALTDPSQNKQRIFAFAAPFNWNDIFAVFRKCYPNQKVMDDVPDLGRDLSVVPNEDAEELLRKHFGRPGFTSLEETVKENLEGMV